MQAMYINFHLWYMLSRLPSMEHKGAVVFYIAGSVREKVRTLLNLHEFKIHYNTTFIILRNTLITNRHYHRLAFSAKNAA
jgi:hypothetical protein